MSSIPNKPGLSIEVTPPPVGPATLALSDASKTAEGRQGLVCYDLLDGKSQALADQDAAKDYPTLFSNNQALLSYGNSTLAPLNALIDTLSRDIKPVDIPQLTPLMNGLNSQMRKLKFKYDVSDPKVAKWIHDSLDGVKVFGLKTRSLLDTLLSDAKNVYQQLDTVKATVYGREMDAARNVGLLDQFYRQNEKEVLAVIYSIAVMEQIATLAKKDASALKPDPNNPADHDLVERQRNLTEFATNMNLKIAEFKNRLFLGWATGPQLTNQRTLNLSLAVRLDLLINVTLPSVKFCIEQWEIAIQEQQMGELIKITDDFTNQVMTTAAAAGATIATFVADVTQTPSLSPSTISAMATSIDNQATAIAQAYTDGIARRKESDAAILAAQKVIANSQAKVSQSVLNDLVGKAQEAQQLSLTEHAQTVALANTAAGS